MKNTFLLCLSLLVAGPAFADHFELEVAREPAHAAHKLQSATEGLVDAIATDFRRYTHVEADAQKLERAAHHFHEQIESHHGSRQHLCQDFSEVTRAYEHFKQAFDRDHEAHHEYSILRYYLQVTATYENLRVLMVSWCGQSSGGGGYHATCEVVREIFGENLATYHGEGRGATEQAALSRAQEQAMSQCRAELGGFLQQCNVNQSKCKIVGGGHH